MRVRAFVSASNVLMLKIETKMCMRSSTSGESLSVLVRRRVRSMLETVSENEQANEWHQYSHRLPQVCYLWTVRDLLNHPHWATGSNVSIHVIHRYMGALCDGVLELGLSGLDCGANYTHV